jgi:uncharacterized protein YeaO (DUF488 family)
MTKEAVAADAWMKDVAPSTDLRQWFGHQVERWEEFRRRYRKELAANANAWAPILDAEARGTVTLLYSAHDVLHNSAVVLRDYLVEREARRPRRSAVPLIARCSRRRRPRCRRSQAPAARQRRGGR